MVQPSFAFTGAAQQQPDSGGLSQYLSQGQAALNPGQASVTGASPLAAAGASNLAKALASMPASPSTQPLPAEVSQTALAAGAAMNPNSPSGENMGGVGPTQQNLALAQGLQNAVNMPNGGQPNDQFQQLLQQSGQPMQGMQNYQNGVSGGGWFGGGSGYGS